MLVCLGMLLSDCEGAVLLAGPGVVGFFTTNQSFDELIELSERRHVHAVRHRQAVFRDQGTACRGIITYCGTKRAKPSIFLLKPEAAGPGGIQYGSQ